MPKEEKVAAQIRHIDVSGTKFVESMTMHENGGEWTKIDFSVSHAE